MTGNCIGLQKEENGNDGLKRSGYFALLAFLAGIVSANLMGQELLISDGILNTYYMEQYLQGSVDSTALFGRIFLERLQMILLLLVAGRLIRSKILFLLTEGVMAGTFGFLMVAAITNLGMNGILIVICALLPQWLFYLAALGLFFLFRMKWEKSPARYGSPGAQMRQASEHIVGYALLFFILLLGMMLETYLNPVIMKQILKLF